MEDRTKENTIIVDLESKESLRMALRAYQERIENDATLTDSDEYYLMCFAKLVDGDIEELDSSDIEDVESLELVLKASDSGKLAFVEARNEEMISNVIVFIAALEYDDLKEEFLILAKQVLRYIKEEEYLEVLWLDGWYVFVMDILVCLVLKHPEYESFISEYIKKNWDSKHATFIFDSFSAIRD